MAGVVLIISMIQIKKIVRQNSYACVLSSHSYPVAEAAHKLSDSLLLPLLYIKGNVFAEHLSVQNSQ
jgi:hypothetical protein